MKKWGDKPYYSVDYYYKNKFGGKTYKIGINANLTCPNRDGLLDTRGCIFCSAEGSGDFTRKELNITEQINTGIKLTENKKFEHYIAYFQAYTNTYGSIEYLTKIFTEAIEHEQIVSLSIATRPDCLSDEVLNLLNQLNQYKPITVELGLQTIHEHTAEFIRRGYQLSCYEQAIEKLKAFNINIVVHLIIGLPYETKKDILDSVKYTCESGANGVKLQLLHILEHTDLATYYKKNQFHVLEQDEYINLLIDCIEIVPEDIVIHRITGDGNKEDLIAPVWSCNKRNVLNQIHKTFKQRNTYQSKLYNKK